MVPHTPRTRLTWVLAALALATHVAVNLTTAYGIHRDEFLYLSMGRHLRLWQMDFPPFIAIVANVARVPGDHLVWLRLPSAVAHALLVLVAAESARLLGARRAGQLLAGLAVLLPPIFLRPGNLLQPVVFDQLWWSLALLAVLHLRRSGDRRWWLAVGAALGMGLLTKFSVAFIAVGIAGALAIGPERRDLLTRWPWLGALLALAVGSPSIAGQLALDWPVRGQMAELHEAQLARVTMTAFLGEQPLMLGGPAVLLAVAGVTWLAVAREARWAREVAIACAIAFLLLLAAQGKGYYAGPIYPVLLGAGAAAVERLARPRVRAVVQGALAASVAVAGIVTAPLGVPILPPDAMIAYTSRLGIAGVTTTNVGVRIDLPQDYADMLGWERLADTVAHVYRSLPPDERRSTVIVGDNYGRAGALEFHGASRGLPEVVSAAGSFWFFGPGSDDARTFIVAGDEVEDLREFCGEVRTGAVIEDPLLVPEERRVVIHLCREPKTSLRAAWPALR